MEAPGSIKQFALIVCGQFFVVSQGGRTHRAVVKVSVNFLKDRAQRFCDMIKLLVCFVLRLVQLATDRGIFLSHSAP